VSNDIDGVDALLGRLEALVAQLADVSSPLERLVADHEEAQRLLGLARQRLEEAARRMAPDPPG
jgi:exodeoxyribonuclease VII small subunit